MNTVIVKSGRFNAHYPVDIPKNTVNAESVLVRLDSEWDRLNVRIHWLNVASNVERKPLLERDQPNTIPWEVLTDLGELRMGLVGLDGKTVIKPTIWITYGYVVDGVDPESGSDPQPPTPSWEQQMVEQATRANQAAQAAQKASEEAAKSAASAGPYADEAKESAEAAKEAQRAASTSAQQANEAAQTAQQAAGSIGDSVQRAEDAATEAGAAKQAAETAQAAASNAAGTAQGAATTASEAAKTAQEAATQAGEYLATVKQDANNAESAALEAGKSQEAARDAAQEAANARDQANTAATAADTAKGAAEQAATTAGNAQSGAAQSAQAAANSAQAAERAKKEAQNAAAAFPAPSPEVAGMVPMVNPKGTGYVFGEAGGGGAGGELLIAEYVQRGNQEIYFSSFDWSSGIGECTEPHGLTEATQAMLVWNDWMAGNVYANATAMPIEWTSLDQYLYLVPTDDTHVMVTGNDKSTPITVDASDDFNKNVDETKIHFEIPIGFRISDIPELYTKVQLTILGVVMGTKRYRYITFFCRKKDGKDVWVNTIDLLYPPYFGVLTKPRHGLLASHNITLELNNAVGGSFLYSNHFTGRRNNYVGMPGEAYTEIKRAIQPYNPAEFLGVTGISVDPSCAVWANGTRFRLYGLCKGGGHN